MQIFTAQQLQLTDFNIFFTVIIRNDKRKNLD